MTTTTRECEGEGEMDAVREREGEAVLVWEYEGVGELVGVSDFEADEDRVIVRVFVLEFDSEMLGDKEGGADAPASTVTGRVTDTLAVAVSECDTLVDTLAGGLGLNDALAGRE